MIKLKKLNEEGLTGGVGSFDAADTGIAYKTLGSVPGMGTIQYPTRDAEGSGDVPSPPAKKKKKKKKKLHEGMKYLKVIEDYIPGKVEEKPKEKIKLDEVTPVIPAEEKKEIPKKKEIIDEPEKSPIQEDLGTGVEVFETELDRGGVDAWNEPAEWSSLSVSQAKVNWEADLEVERYGIGGVNLSVSSIYFAGEVDKGEEYQDWELEITSKDSEIETDKNTALIPLYPTNVEIDFNKSSNRKDWKIKVTFGTHGD